MINAGKRTIATPEQHILALTLTLVTLLLIYSGFAQRLNHILYDNALKLWPVTAQSDIALIAIDERSLAALGRWPWPRSQHAKLLDILSEEKPKAIALDIILAEPSSEQDDAALTKAMSDNGRVVLPVHIHPLSNRSTLAEIPPYAPFAQAALAMGHAHVELDKDGVSRGLYLFQGLRDSQWPALAYALAQHTGLSLNRLATETSEAVPAYVNIRQHYRLVPFAGVSGSFDTYSYSEVLNGRVPAEVFRNKVVFIGATAAGMGDYVPTPMSGRASPMPGVEMHVNVYNALAQRALMKPIAPVWQYLLSVALVLIPVLLLPRIKPAQTIPGLLLVVTGAMGFSWLLLRVEQLWFGPAESLAGILLAYPLWSWRRLTQLNAFLNRELERLHREPTLGARLLVQRPVSQIFDSLQATLSPAAAVLLIDGELVRSSASESPEVPRQLNENHWLHQARWSWLKIYRGNTEFIIGLFWEEQPDISQFRSFLHRLPLIQSDLLDTGAAPRSEMIARRIRQVQSAINTLQEMRKFISDGFENMPDGVIVTDPLGTIVFVNTHIGFWLDEPREALVGQPLTRLLTNKLPKTDKDWGDQIRKVLLQGEDIEIEANRGQRDLLFHLVPFQGEDPGESGIIVNISDITRLKTEQRRRSETIDFLSHDVRTPLVSQLALLDRLRDGSAEWGPEALDSIERQTKRSLNLAEQFLQLTRAEHTSPANFSNCELLTIAENAIDAVEPYARQQGIRVAINQDDEFWVLGGAELIERSLINLLSNAIEHSPSGTTIEVALACDDQHIRLSVKDQGKGISAEVLPHLFDRFNRGGKASLSSQTGAGLGLAFVKVVMEKHQGSVSVDSEPGTGSVFTLLFNSDGAANTLPLDSVTD